jgi:phosphatidylserine/phosphatidylglycerophosphate/cardiolipin synthase-like enzyme
MAAFTRPFDPGAVSRALPDLRVALPDPGRQLADPLIRPGVARYAGRTLILLHVTAGGTFALVSPAQAAAREVTLEPGTLPGITSLLEISPLPFAISPVLRALRPGAPTFYIGAPGLTFPENDGLMENAAPLGSVTEAFVGVLFQDSVTMAPWAWIELIRAALETSGDTDGADDWGTLTSLYSGVRGLRVLDHAGNLLDGATFDIRIRRADSTFEGPYTRTTGPDGDLEEAVVAAPLPRAAGMQPSLFGGSAEQTELRWVSSAPIDGTPFLVHALYETGLSSPPSQGALLLPAGTERAHLQVLELDRWFAGFRNGTSPQLARFRENSRLEPLIDGTEAFRRLADDLIACAAPGCGAHFTSLIFKDFPLNPRALDANGDPVDTRLTALTQRIVDAGGGARFLPHKWVNLSENPDTEAKVIAVLVLVLATNLLLLASMRGLVRTSTAGYIVVLGGEVLLLTAIIAFLDVSELLEEKVEPSRDIVPLLNAIESNIAIWAFHPVRSRDNPLRVPLPFDLETYLDKFGFWHQKLQLVKRPAAAGTGEEFVAYVGGIDVNPNRIDTPGHQGSGSYHDIQARVTGPGAADVFLSFDERWAFHRADPDHPVQGATPGPAFAPPDPAAIANQPARHIVHVGRTYFLSHPDDRPNPLPFAREGDTSIYDTMVRAIRSAKEYIYVEDQYFTPNDSDPDDPADSYFDALLAASQTCKRLVIVVPTETDQVFGDQRRRNLFARLRAPTAWGDRVLVGTPLRRHLLADPGRIAHEGRCYLMKAIGMPGISGFDTVVLGPAARVPESFPYWLWIDGELMLTAGLPFPTTEMGMPCRAVDVLRGAVGTDPRWGASPRPHQLFAPATMAQQKGIFVHAKVTMIDDTYITIGSANINRRGFFYDGELNVFAVPEQLRAAPENPARAMRTALWAEQLGLAPSMGPALLGDPIAAFELFRRSRFEGNRFTPFEALDLKPYLDVPVGDGLIINLLAATIIGWTASHVELLWNDVLDPTSFSDEHPVPGPLTT